MPNLISLLHQYGVLIVFAIVLVEQIGLPIPAVPILIVAGALSVIGDMSWPLVLLVSLLACAISDYTWFRAGRHYGSRILRLMCRISLSPDHCVRQTEDKFNHWGPKALVVAKFIPGFNTIAAPMSGAMGISSKRFLSFSLMGGLLWSGTYIAVGAIFHASVDRVLAALSTMGSTAVGVLAVLLALFVAYKYLERRRFRKAMQLERIDIDDLFSLIDGGHDPVLVDARSTTAQGLEAAIPGALLFNATDSGPVLAALDRDRHVIVYCSCPNDITAISVAQQLMTRGYHRAKPLRGGLDAWNQRAPLRNTSSAETAVLAR